MDWKSQLLNSVRTNDLDRFNAILNTAEVRANLGSITSWKTEEHALHLAAFLGHVEMLQLLLSSGAKINSKWVDEEDGDRGTPLHHAVLGNDGFKMGAARTLIRAGADVRLRGSMHWNGKLKLEVFSSFDWALPESNNVWSWSIHDGTSIEGKE